MLTRSLITISPLFLLISCGSSSESEESSKPPVEYQFELSAKLVNQCDVAVGFTQYEVQLQDENWQLISKYVPNAEGVVNFITEAKEINYTIVAKYQEGNGEEGYDIVSYYKADTETPAKYIATFDQQLDNSNCECITQDIDLQHRTFSRIDTVSTSFTYDSWQSSSAQNTYFNGAEVCHEVGTDWPINSIAIRGVDTNDSAIGVASLLTGYSRDEDNVWQAAAIEVAEIVYLPKDHASFQLSQKFNGISHFTIDVDSEDEELTVFNSHPYISESVYQSNSGHVFEDIETLFGHSILSSHHSITSPQYDETFEVSASENKPDIDNTQYSELASDGSYDYSAVSGYPMVKFVFDYEVESQADSSLIPTKWTMYGPISGQLPSSTQLAGLEGVLMPDSEILSADIQIVRSVKSNDYEDYIRYYQGDNDTDFSDDLSYYRLKLDF